jgi:dihydrofolate synthase/folylpolyglutamate synthase
MTAPELNMMPHAAAHPGRAAAVGWLMGRINYERTALIPYGERQLKLDRMRSLLVRLGRPDAGLKIVHVAGTKGKGSTSAMIAAMLTAAGYRTGVFSSPHLERIEERFAVDGRPCSAAELVTLVDRLQPIVHAIDAEAAEQGDPLGGPTFFEIITAIALVHFVERQVDAAVLEVGLGGRLDATNVSLPAVSVITSIDFDHTRQLGNTLAAIAGEKAGIIKPGVPVVSGVIQPEAQAVVAAVAREHGCRLIQLGRDFSYTYQPPKHCGLRIADCGFVDPQSEIRNPKSEMEFRMVGQEFNLEHVALAMRGPHQAANAATALAAVAELRRQGWCVSTDAIRDGLGRAVVPARVELIAGEPAVVLDTAHNPASARALVAALAELPRTGRRTLLLSVSRDKDVRAIVGELAPHFDRVVVTQYRENPRAVAVEELAEIVRELAGNGNVISCVTPNAAWHAVCGTAEPGELVAIAGSFFLAAELQPIVLARQDAAAT